MANSDMELVREFAVRGDGQAFETLVTRYINLVYSSAARQVRDPHLAEDVTQAVFIILARKAHTLGADTILASWLHRAAGYAAADVLKKSRRRTQHEQEALMHSSLDEPENEAWRQIAPHLDAAIAALNEPDRRAIMLRYFQNKSLRDVGVALGGSEEAARKRVDRALEKLHGFFLKRGVVSTAALIAGVISANSVQAAPPTLAKITAAAALAKGAAAGGSTITLAKTALKIMAWTKAKTALVAAVAIIAGVSATMIAVNSRSKTQSDPETAAASPDEWIWEANSQTLDRVPPMLVLRPSTLSSSATPFDMYGKNRYLARGKTLKELLASIYGQKDSQLKLNFPDGLPDEKFDCIVTLPTKWWDTLETEIDRRYGLTTIPNNRANSVSFVRTVH